MIEPTTLSSYPPTTMATMMPCQTTTIGLEAASIRCANSNEEIVRNSNAKKDMQ